MLELKYEPLVEQLVRDLRIPPELLAGPPNYGQAAAAVHERQFRRMIGLPAVPPARRAGSNPAQQGSTLCCCSNYPGGRRIV